MTLDISKYPTLALANTPDELRSLPKEALWMKSYPEVRITHRRDYRR